MSELVQLSSGTTPGEFQSTVVTPRQDLGITSEVLERINHQNLEARELLEWATATLGNRVALACSFGAEDVVLIDLLSQVTSEPNIFTLDTGRLPPETYQLMEELQNRYRLTIRVFFPDHSAVEEMVNRYGMNLFYHGVDQRKLCCRIRKVEPLQRALSGLSAWITGLRREQSAQRSHTRKAEQDGPGLVKLSPLADWSKRDVWDYIGRRELPYNRLHDQGYPSIGCAPCTRPVAPGEDPRAGRWWWETSSKECGLHDR